MVQQVEVDGQIHEFPDEATPAMITGALKKESARQAFINATQNGIFSRPMNKLTQDALDTAKSAGSTVVQGIPALLNEVVSSPGTALKDVGAGLSSIPFNIGKAIVNTPQYVAGLESPEASDWIKKITPDIPVEDIVNATFGVPTKGGQQIRDLASLAPVLGPLGKAAGKSAIGAATGAISKVVGKTDPLLAANEAALGSQISDKAVEVAQKTEAAMAADEANQQAISQAKQELGKSDADTMQFNLNQRKQKIQDMTDQVSGLKQQLSQTKPSETELPEAEQNLADSQEHLNNAQNVGSDIDKNISQYLNEGAQHDVQAAKGISKRVNSIEDYWNNAYKTFTQNVADSNFQMPNTAMEKLDYDSMSPTQLIQTFGADAFEALKKGKMQDFIDKQKVKESKESSANNPYLSKLMEVAPTITDNNAATFLAKYKDFRDRTYKLGQRFRDPRTEEVEKEKMQDALKQAKQMQSQMKDVLDEGLGEYKSEFERVNKGYSEQVFPLRDNPIVQKANDEKLPDNIIKEMRTDEEGMPLVREIVKQDPEILRNVVGQRYFAGKAARNSIHNPNETMREYLNEMPDLQEMLSQRENANAALVQAKSNAEMAKQRHADVISRQGEASKIEKKAMDMQADIDSHNKEIEKLKKHIDILNKTRNQKNITLKEKLKSEREYKEAQKNLKETSMALDEKTTGLRKFLRAAKMIYRGGKFITTGS